MLEGDPACPYYVHLGSAFPERPLAATVHLLNHRFIRAPTFSYFFKQNYCTRHCICKCII